MHVQVTYHGLQIIFQHLHITKGNAFPAAGGVKPEAPSPMQVLHLCHNSGNHCATLMTLDLSA